MRMTATFHCGSLLQLALLASLSSTEAFVTPTKPRLGSPRTTTTAAAVAVAAAHPTGMASVWLANDVTADTANALNGAMDSSGMEALQSAVDANALTIDSGDPAVLLAGGVAVVALLGLAVSMIQLPPAVDATPTIDADKLSSESSAKLEATLTEGNDENKAVLLSESSSQNDNAGSNITGDKGDDDIDQNEALKAFERRDKAGFLGVWGRLQTRLQGTRQALQQEKQLRIEVEQELQEASEAMIELEDKYELEQNELNSVKQKLLRTQTDLQQTQNQLRNAVSQWQDTQADLRSTQKVLDKTTENLQQLEEERKSLRKLSRVAWQLSKERVGKRLSFLRRKEDESDEELLNE